MSSTSLVCTQRTSRPRRFLAASTTGSDAVRLSSARTLCSGSGMTKRPFSIVTFPDSVILRDGVPVGSDLEARGVVSLV